MKPIRRKKRSTRRWEYAEAEPRVQSIDPPAEPALPAAGRTYCVMAMPPAGENNYSNKNDHDTDKPARMPVERVQARHRTKAAPPRSGGVRRLVRVAVGLIMALAAMTSPLWLTSEPLLPVMKQLSAASAAMTLPEGTSGGIVEGEVVVPEDTTAATTTTTTAATTAAPTTTTTQPAADLRPVSEKKLGNSGTQVGDIYVKNSTDYSPDFAKLLSSEADCKIKLNAGYQVLIIHTHTTECYAQRDDGWYSTEYSPRTTDHSQSIVAVGDVLAEQLEAVGIRTLHVTEMHDYPQYNGSYDRALETIEKYLKEYPSIEMVLDVHRDAITYDDGTKLKPTAEIDGKKAAQVMIISGCDAGGRLWFPEWESNLTMALQIQQAAQSKFPGLMRPLSFAPYRYNMHMTPNSLLVEFGTDANTLDEALYSAQMLGQSIAEVLLEYVV